MRHPGSLGIVAHDRIPRWQHDAIRRLREAGVTIAARFPAAPEETRQDGLETVAWDAPPIAHAAAAEQLDAVLAFATPQLPAALAAARFGEWEVVLPGDPPAFRAVEARERVVAIHVERLRADGGRQVIARATIAVDIASYPRTLAHVLRCASELPLEALARARAGAEAGGTPAPRPRAIVVDRRRRTWLTMRCMGRRLALRLRFLLFHDRWRVGVLETPPARLLAGAPPAIRWLRLPRNRFWADPFPVAVGNDLAVLCEGYDYPVERGYLAIAPLDARREVGVPRPLLRTDHHLSYPYVVAEGAQRYVIPEQHQARRVVLYALENGRLEERAVLLDGIAGVDPTLFRHDGRWWLFLTDHDRDDNGELLLFHAPELTGPWSAHPLNPVVRDVRCARPAGTPFVVDGTLYRPGQDSSRTYGGRVALARVDALTPRIYHETVVAHLEPPAAGPGRHGLHTLAMGEGIVLVDGKDVVLDAGASWATLRRYVRALGRRSGATVGPSSPAARHGASRPAPHPGGTLPPT